MTTLTLARIPPVAVTVPRYRRTLYWLPLALTLAAQTALSVRLLRTAPLPSGDEGRYIYAGHQLIHELWHGGGSPYYETYFSGAPVVYPVLAAMVDHVSGLTGVRLMSLEFMLTATCLLFASGRRLFGYWPAVTAAGLFAGLGLTQNLGVYATYDAMSLMLMTAAAYCAVRTAGPRRESMWLLLVPVALLAANATKYVTLAFDPAVLALAAFQADTWKRAGQRLLALGSATTALLAIAAFLAGGAYLHGVMYTTLSRNSAFQAFLGGAKLQPAHMILAESWTWTGITVGLGILAVVWAAAMRADKQRVALLAVLVCAGLLVTVEALKLHSDQSMRKHDDFGAWFACLAGGSMLGYARSLLKGSTGRLVTAALTGAVVLVSGVHYSSQAGSTYEAHPDLSVLAARKPLRPYLAAPGRLLLGGLMDDSLLYSDHLAIPWWQHFDDEYIKYPVPGRGGDSHGQTRGAACMQLRPGCMYLEGPAGYRAAIRAHWFTLVSMIGSHDTPQDHVIEQAVEHTPGYVLLTQVGGHPTWVFRRAYRALIRSLTRS